MRRRYSTGARVFQFINYTVLSLLALSMIIPFLQVISVSFSSPGPVERQEVFLLPVEFTLASYEYVLARPDIWRAFGVTLFVTIFGTLNSLFWTAMLAYPMAKKQFALRKPLALYVLFTMIFSVPVIPYFLTVRALGLYDTAFALILPSTISAFNLFIMRTFFERIPEALEESAKIDGANDFGILFRIVMPLSKPALATLGLFYSLVYWNMFFHALLFIRSPEKMPLQVLVRRYIADPDQMIGSIALNLPYNMQTLQMAVVLVSTLPIVLVYPFLQKYFVKGATLGSIKE